MWMSGSAKGQCDRTLLRVPNVGSGARWSGGRGARGKGVAEMRAELKQRAGYESATGSTCLLRAGEGRGGEGRGGEGGGGARG
jgi:hypothetical protein